MPQVRSSKNRSLVIKADIGQELGIDPNTVFNVVLQEGKVILEPVKDPMEEEILAAYARSMEAIKKGDCSPAFNNMEDMEQWLDAELENK